MHEHKHILRAFFTPTIEIEYDLCKKENCA